MAKERWCGYGVGCISVASGWADEKAQSAERETSRNEQREEVREQVHGYQLMTPAERDAYRERMRAARTVEEREQPVSSTMPGCRRVRRSRGWTCRICR